jgi:hypothetical protein
MNWNESYRAALVEVDPVKLLALISETEVAMTLRSGSLPAISDQERQAMGDATCSLGILKGPTT